MKIFHTGDVHLDTPFSGLGQMQSALRRSELRDTFSRMIRYAKDNNADMVVIAGDLFDREFVTRDTVTVLKAEFSRLECPVVITPGNHDPATFDSIWLKDLFPDNVYVFKKNSIDMIPFDDLGCDVYGYAFTEPDMTECPIAGKTVESKERINILVAHGDTVSPISRNCPLSPAVLRSFGADYCALGHIHNPMAANEQITGIGAYCGCPEGRDFGECGEKGALMTEITKIDGKVSVKTDFIKFSNKIYRVCETDVSGAMTAPEITEKLISEAEKNGFGEDTLVRFVLTGAVEPALSIDEKRMAESIKTPFYTEVKDKTSPTWNSDYLENDKGIRGEVYRVLMPLLSSDDPAEREKGSKALKYALGALNGEVIIPE